MSYQLVGIGIGIGGLFGGEEGIAPDVVIIHSL